MYRFRADLESWFLPRGISGYCHWSQILVRAIEGKPRGRPTTNFHHRVFELFICFSFFFCNYLCSYISFISQGAKTDKNPTEKQLSLFLVCPTQLGSNTTRLVANSSAQCQLEATSRKAPKMHLSVSCFAIFWELTVVLLAQTTVNDWW